MSDIRTLLITLLQEGIKYCDEIVGMDISETTRTNFLCVALGLLVGDLALWWRCLLHEPSC